MGSFQGHALPGSFFLLFGIWWTIQITRRMVACKVKGIPFYNTVTYPCYCGFITFPIEGVVKLVITSIGMVAEGVSSANPLMSGNVGRVGDYHGFWIGDIQHVTMYLFFFLSGVFDILVNRRCSVIPPGMDYVASVLAFVVEGLLFKFHIHGRDPLDATLHTLLLYTIAGCVISCLLEYKYPDSIQISLSRTFFTFLQGTWFWQVGFILYPPFYSMKHWDGTDHESIMLCTAIFTWHIAVVLFIMASIAAVTYMLSTRVCTIRKGSKEYLWTGNNRFVAVGNYNRNAMEVLSSSSEEEEETVFSSSVGKEN